jgi:hypothetical protein
LLKELLGVYFWREGLEAALGPEGAGTLCDEGANQLNFEPIAKHEQVSLDQPKFGGVLAMISQI